MTPEAIRLSALVGGIAFTAVVIAIIRPQRGVLRLTIVPSLLFATADLVMEALAHEYGIWICHGEPQVLHVPVVMVATFFMQGISLCVVAHVIFRYRKGTRAWIDLAAFVTILGIVLYFTEFVWRDAGLTTYVGVSTHWYVLAAWQSLLWILVGSFLALVGRYVGFKNIKTRKQVLEQKEC